MTQQIPDQYAPAPYTAVAEGPAPSATAEPGTARAEYVRGARYGAALAATLLGGYLMATQGIGQFVQLTLIGNGEPEVAVLVFSRFLFGVVVLVVGLLVAPTSVARRVIAAGIAVVLTVVSSLLFAGRLNGDVPLPHWSSGFLHPAFVATLAATVGWLIVRERHPLTFLLLILTVVLGVLPHQFIIQSVPSAVTELTVVPLAAIVGVGIAWAAAGITRAFRGR